MSFWGWVGAIAAGWLTVSVIVAAGWAVLGLRRGPRPVPGDTHLHVVHVDGYPVMADDVYDVEREGL